MNKPATVLLHPACASNLQTVDAIEAATGLRAVISRNSRVVRLVPVLKVVAGKRVSA
jgi:hypothetical protein